MNMSDSIADMLTRVRNAVKARHDTVETAHSHLKAEIVRILKKEGFICDYAVEGGTKKTLRIYLKYLATGEPVIVGLKRRSTPGRRVYASADAIPKSAGMGIIILTTPAGVLTGREAKKRNVGGEVMCEVW